jgi:hypothetical protein
MRSQLLEYMTWAGSCMRYARSNAYMAGRGFTSQRSILLDEYTWYTLIGRQTAQIQALLKMCMVLLQVSDV